METFKIMFKICGLLFYFNVFKFMRYFYKMVLYFEWFLGEFFVMFLSFFFVFYEVLVFEVVGVERL